MCNTTQIHKFKLLKHKTQSDGFCAVQF